MTKCAKCGAPISEETTSCPECGYVIEKKQKDRQITLQVKFSTICIIAVSIVMVAAISMIGYTIYLHNTDEYKCEQILRAAIEEEYPGTSGDYKYFVIEKPDFYTATAYNETRYANISIFKDTWEIEKPQFGIKKELWDKYDY